jgi:hypothetical protein
MKISELTFNLKDNIPHPSIIKERAKQLRKLSDNKFSHCECLNEIVKQYGFKSFSSYLYYLEPDRKKGDGNIITERNRK